MSAVRLYIDEDAMHAGLISGLRARKMEVQTVVEAGLAGEDDETQLAFAAQSSRTLYSFNVRDLCRLHGEWQSAGRHHAGIIVVPSDLAAICASLLVEQYWQAFVHSRGMGAGILRPASLGECSAVMG